MNTPTLGFSFHNTWRAPREAYLYGGLPYLILFTVAMAVLALPVVLLQLAIGQLSQVDAVGVWIAVPFFRGIGYLRLLVSFLVSIYSAINMSLTMAYFLYTISGSTPFLDCMDFIPDLKTYKTVYNASECLVVTFMAPVDEKPKYYAAVALIITVVWIMLPFLLYKPAKYTKRINYILGPVVLILSVVVLSCISNWSNMVSFATSGDWSIFLKPDIWQSAVVQALLSSQIAGGFLISAGNSIYSSSNIHWTTLTFVGANLVSTWLSVLFWHSLADPNESDPGLAAVLVQLYQMSGKNGNKEAWSLVIFTILILSGLITMLSLVYPIFHWLRRVGGIKWRLLTLFASIVGAGTTLAILVGRLTALAFLEDIAVPIVATITTVLEITVFVFIYGWRFLVDDVEFLTDRKFSKYWVWGWFATPGIIALIFFWWITVLFKRNMEGGSPPWTAATATVTIVLVFAILFICAIYSVWKQEQSDIIGKLKSSFKPSRYWGSRDPITLFYSLGRRDEFATRCMPRNRSTRRRPSQISRSSSRLQVLNMTPLTGSRDFKQRSNSDGWLYTVYRRMRTDAPQMHDMRRSNSTDGGATANCKQNCYVVTFNNETSKISLNSNVVSL